MRQGREGKLESHDRLKFFFVFVFLNKEIWSSQENWELGVFQHVFLDPISVLSSLIPITLKILESCSGCVVGYI